jgi:hypothetical protein
MTALKQRSLPSQVTGLEFLESSLFFLKRSSVGWRGGFMVAEMRRKRKK